MALKRRTKIDLLILAAVLICGVVAVKNAVSIGDWFHAQTYKPSSEVITLAQDAGMNSKGRQLFYRFSPELVDKDTLVDLCGPRIGCVDGRKIYILHASNAAEQNRNVVTAAHEMLHVAYSRLTIEEKADLKQVLDRQIADKSLANMSSRLLFYRNRPERYYDEAHSYIGTEVTKINPRLEAHYQTYFGDRSKVTAAFLNSPEGYKD